MCSLYSVRIHVNSDLSEFAFNFTEFLAPLARHCALKIGGHVVFTLPISTVSPILNGLNDREVVGVGMFLKIFFFKF